MSNTPAAEPRSLPVLPIRDAVIYPQTLVPLEVSRPSSIAAVEAALRTEDKRILVVAETDAQTLYPTGTEGVIRRATRKEGGFELLVLGTERMSLLKVEQTEPYTRARVKAKPLESSPALEVEALRRTLMELAERIVELGHVAPLVDLERSLGQIHGAAQFAYALAAMVGLKIEKAQRVLEAPDVAETLRILYQIMLEESQVLEIRQKIQDQAKSELDKQQRDYWLRQQMDAIQKELGEGSPEKAEGLDLRKRLSAVELPEAVRKEAERELARLEKLPPAAADYQVIRTHLDLLLELPWSKSTEDVIELPGAKAILDEDHYDLQEIKDRILEHLAILKLNPRARAPILCFVGPPGVGKTSLGQSIARAMGRKFERLSLGGMHDEAELRGHRRTYVGALPGSILQAVRRAGVNNPLLMLDEIDKIGHDFRGDPAAALLEVLDPAQNHAFRDNYLDLPFDLSHVFFITTANTTDTIPGVLFDRMEGLHLTGYTELEKLEIAKRYLLPRRLVEAGISPERLKLDDSLLRAVISRFTREAGVRELERAIGRIAAKVARKFAEGEPGPIAVNPNELESYLGHERFRIEEARRELPAGVAAGLAWTPAGGEILYIEALLIRDSTELRLTGQLGEVMRESAKAAQSYLMAQSTRWGIDSSRFRNQGVHIHVPAGATPKDGPSAGVAIVAALASVFSGVACRSDTAMTGEITLTGLVLPVGGIKEKVLAAHRAGITRVILPRYNEKDISDVPEQVKNDLSFVWADNIDDVISAVLPALTRPALAAAS